MWALKISTFLGPEMAIVVRFSALPPHVSCVGSPLPLHREKKDYETGGAAIVPVLAGEGRVESRRLSNEDGMILDLSNDYSAIGAQLKYVSYIQYSN